MNFASDLIWLTVLSSKMHAHMRHKSNKMLWLRSVQHNLVSYHNFVTLATNSNVGERVSISKSLPETPFNIPFKQER